VEKGGLKRRPHRKRVLGKPQFPREGILEKKSFEWRTQLLKKGLNSLPQKYILSRRFNELQNEMQERRGKKEYN